MCIIAVCDKRSLTKNEFEYCFDLNPHGIGIAWTDEDFSNNYVKGLINSREDAWEMYKGFRNIFPHVIHFRLATVGKITDELCHPFIIEEHSPLKTYYSGYRQLLFHNGTAEDWPKYFEKMLHYHPHIKNKISGRISDSRMFAASLALNKFEKIKTVLKENNGKFVIFSKNSFKLYGKFIERDGVHFSNTGFLGWRNISKNPDLTKTTL